MNLAIKPLEYYKFRSSHPDLEIKYLSDKYGSDVRLSYSPYCRTLLEEGERCFGEILIFKYILRFLII